MYEEVRHVEPKIVQTCQVNAHKIEHLARGIATTSGGRQLNHFVVEGAHNCGLEVFVRDRSVVHRARSEQGTASAETDKETY